MNLKKLFSDDPSKWDALSDASKKALSHHSPFSVTPTKPTESKKQLSPERQRLLSLADGTRTLAELSQILSLKSQTVRNKIWSLKQNGFNPEIIHGRPRVTDKKRDVIMTLSNPSQLSRSD